MNARLLKPFHIKITSILLVLFCSLLHAGTINKLVTEKLNHKLGKELLTSNNLYIFHSTHANSHEVVALDLDTMEETVLLTDLENGVSSDSDFFELPNGYIILRAKMGTRYQLFQSDGNQIFTPITEKNMVYQGIDHIPVTNGYFSMFDNNKTLFWTNGVTLNQFDFSHVMGASPLCVFNQNQMILVLRGDEGETIAKLSNGELTSLFEQYSYGENSMAASGEEACLLKLNDETGQNKIIHVVESGEAQVTSRNDRYVYPLGNKFIALAEAKIPFTATRIELLDNQNLEVESSSDFPLDQLVGFHILHERIIATFEYETTGSEFVGAKYNNNLQRIEWKPVLGPLWASTKSQEYFYKDGIIDSLTGESITMGKLPADNSTLNNPQSDYFLITTSDSNDVPNQNETFVFLDIPRISDLISGAWLDASMQNQGVSINPGVRQDGSHYIFMTYYLFRAGEPLWLAGIADYQPGQKEVTLLLSEYEGANYLDFVNTPDRTTFGEIKLKLRSCNTIDAKLEYDGTEVNLNWTRLDDVTFSGRCN